MLFFDLKRESWFPFFTEQINLMKKIRVQNVSKELSLIFKVVRPPVLDDLIIFRGVFFCKG